MAFDQVGEPVQAALAVGGPHPAPLSFESGAGGCDRAVEILRRGLGDAADLLAGRGIIHRERLVRSGRDMASVDEQLVLAGDKLADFGKDLDQLRGGGHLFSPVAGRSKSYADGTQTFWKTFGQIRTV